MLCVTDMDLRKENDRMFCNIHFSLAVMLTIWFGRNVISSVTRFNFTILFQESAELLASLEHAHGVLSRVSV